MYKNYRFSTDRAKSDQEMEVHVEKLSRFCRICGEARALMGDRQRVAKENYMDAFLDIYSIDLAKDDKEVHPPYVCFNTCHTSLQRDRSKLKAKGGKRSGSGSGIERNTAREFQPHELILQAKGHCTTCDLRQSPRKRTPDDAELRPPSSSDGVDAAKKC